MDRVSDCGSLDDGSIPSRCTRRRGSQAVDGDSFENCFGAFASTWVRIPPSPQSSHSSMDRVPVSETVDAGSIPAGSTITEPPGGIFQKSKLLLGQLLWSPVSLLKHIF